jgi:hypothetical protein
MKVRRRIRLCGVATVVLFPLLYLLRFSRIEAHLPPLFFIWLINRIHASSGVVKKRLFGGFRECVSRMAVEVGGERSDFTCFCRLKFCSALLPGRRARDSSSKLPGSNTDWNGTLIKNPGLVPNPAEAGWPI